MKKRVIALLAACLLLFGCGLYALAEEADAAPAGDDGARYGSYEDDWFDNGYEEIEKNDPDLIEEPEPPQRWYQSLSVIPVVIGVVAGAAAVAFLYRRSRPQMPAPAPFERRVNISVAAQSDRLAEETHTRRSLSATNSGEK